MGCGLSVTEEAARSRQIGRELRRDFSREKEVVKLLLLGAGESGKSTIVKQMKLLHPVNERDDVGFTEEERAEARLAIFANVLDSAVALLEAMPLLGLSFNGNVKMEEDKGRVLRFAANPSNRNGNLPEGVVRAVQRLWANSTMQLCYQRRNEFQLKTY